jgi:hypothetical protein
MKTRFEPRLIMADALRFPVLTNAVSRDQQDQRALQISLDLYIPKKELAKLVPKFHLYMSKVIHDILLGTTRSQKEL